MRSGVEGAAESGQDAAESIQLGIEYAPAPPFESGRPEIARPEILAAVRTRMNAMRAEREARVTKVVAATGFDQWQVAPVRLTSNWMPRARFSHAAHITQPCISCHDGAPRSKRSSDILMPRIEKSCPCQSTNSSGAPVTFAK